MVQAVCVPARSLRFVINALLRVTPASRCPALPACKRLRRFVRVCGGRRWNLFCRRRKGGNFMPYARVVSTIAWPMRLLRLKRPAGEARTAVRSAAGALAGPPGPASASDCRAIRTGCGSAPGRRHPTTRLPAPGCLERAACRAASTVPSQRRQAVTPGTRSAVEADLQRANES